MAGGKNWHFKLTESKKEEGRCNLMQILQPHANQLHCPTVQSVCDLTTQVHNEYHRDMGFKCFSMFSRHHTAQQWPKCLEEGGRGTHGLFCSQTGARHELCSQTPAHRGKLIHLSVSGYEFKKQMVLRAPHSIPRWRGWCYVWNMRQSTLQSQGVVSVSFMWRGASRSRQGSFPVSVEFSSLGMLICSRTFRIS